MPNKTLTKIISLVLINSLTAILVFQIFLFLGRNAPAQAQTPGDYSAKWEPKSCRVLSYGIKSIAPLQQIDIGVAVWLVTYSGSITNQETWWTPDSAWDNSSNYQDVATKTLYNYNIDTCVHGGSNYNTPILARIGAYGWEQDLLGQGVKGITSEAWGSSTPKKWCVKSGDNSADLIKSRPDC